MGLILSLDSTTSVCSVAVHSKGALVGSKLTTTPRAASSQLLIEARELLKKYGISTGELDAVAVSSGPGSYTGLRIATSSAKGLCFALNIPLVSVNSLLVLAKAAIGNSKSDLYCPMLDARRLEVYTMLMDQNLAEVEPVQALVLDSNSFSNYLDKATVSFFGDGSEKFKALANHPNAIYVDGVLPLAENLGALAWTKYANQVFEDLGNFEPMYLKDFLVKKPKDKILSSS